MIKNIHPYPLRQRIYKRYNGEQELQLEFLVLLEDDTQCTIWIASEAAQDFVNGGWKNEEPAE